MCAEEKVKLRVAPPLPPPVNARSSAPVSANFSVLELDFDNFLCKGPGSPK